MKSKKFQIRNYWQHKKIMLLAFLLLNAFCLLAQKYELPSVRFVNGKLQYTPDSLGNQIPDYSFCGYLLSESPIPNVPVKAVVSPAGNDAAADIQKAIDHLSGLPVGQDGFRGAVLLEKGVYNLKGRLRITASGIVIRGSGKETIINAAGTDRETLIRIFGEKNIKNEKTAKIISKYIPVNSKEIKVAGTEGFHVGDPVIIHRPSTKEWIQKLKMEEYGGDTGWLGWKPGERDMYWERVISGIEGNTIILNAPVTAAIDAGFGGGEVSSFSWPGRISNIGIENLTLQSDYDVENLKDENHCWFAITMESVQNAWVRQVNFKHFAGSAVALYETASRITVEDCISTEPVSEIAGQRRNTFFTMGQQTLFLRCYAENGYHDFATGFCAAGPNAFVQCESSLPYNFSGAIDSWATGVLFDIVNVDGNALSFKNRGQDGQGAGWTAANSMFWQCSAGRIECFQPPTAQNYAYGAWSQFAGDGLWYEENSHVNPRSLFFQQLAERLNKNPKEYQDELIPFSGESTSSPTIEQAKEYSDQSYEPPIQLKDFIANSRERNPISTSYASAGIRQDIIKIENEAGPVVKPVEIRNGWLIQDSKIITGFRLEEPWWRGDPRPFEAENATPAITRFVPGRVGNGFTDELDAVVDTMVRKNIAVFEHNYGLWYDRRRDDHERVRRFDSESWAPFYEQPFARVGKEEAWDRLSRYDLTKYNPWYWNRLRQFSELAAAKGKILIHQNYFQHHILEAGAHWVDCPWRPANNINNTGFPEPPPFSGDKRIYLAEQFYDENNPVRRELHKAYIRQCMNNFAGQDNIIQTISAEFTGPLHFVEFWLDVIAEWEMETGNHPKIALSTTKDVQDAILADPKRAAIVDIIDIRYWAYRADGSLYDPPGGKQMAPRQLARKISPGNRSFDSVYRSVLEYTTNYPEKPVIYSEGNYTNFGWAVLMAGGSLAPLTVNLPAGVIESISTMKPVSNAKNNNLYLLENKGESILGYHRGGGKAEINLKEYNGNYTVYFINPENGEILNKKETISGGKTETINLPVNGDNMFWITKNQ